MLGDREAEAGAAQLAAARLVDAIKALEEARQVLSGNAGAVVAHVDLDPPRRPRAPRLTSLPAGVFDGVVDQTLEDAPEPIAVGDDLQRARIGDGQPGLLALGRRREGGLDVLQYLRHADVVEPRRTIAGLEP